MAWRAIRRSGKKDDEGEKWRPGHTGVVGAWERRWKTSGRSSSDRTRPLLGVSTGGGQQDEEQKEESTGRGRREEEAEKAQSHRLEVELRDFASKDSDGLCGESISGSRSRVMVPRPAITCNQHRVKVSCEELVKQTMRSREKRVWGKMEVDIVDEHVVTAALKPEANAVG